MRVIYLFITKITHSTVIKKRKDKKYIGQC